ncbi:MAG: hypothetical protein DRQ51_08130 [Gammaproteobacteria bacterium]|nr:MAG: hypothetical protein DRQ51_08130 [Gammaproteobacteria bacterium]
MSFGTNETGGFAWTTITPKERGKNGYGIYFFQGKFGYFYHINFSKNIAERLKVHANTADDFIQITSEEIGAFLWQK